MVLIIISIIFLAYASLIVGAIIGINKKTVIAEELNSSPTKFSVLIPFRNEASNLKNLILSLNNIDYNKTAFELIFINDHSTDCFENNFSHLKKQLNHKLLYLASNIEGKKNAILEGLKLAKHDYIITLDADCIVPENILSSYNFIIKNEAYDMIVGSVMLTSSNQLVEKFQYLDYLAMQGVGLGWANLNQPFLCSGANLCYKKSVFKKLNPFEGNLKVASGDDLFTLVKFKKAKMKIGTNLKAVVLSSSQSSWKSLFSQRKRWLSKNSLITDSFFKLASGIVFFTNLSLLLLVFLCFIDLTYLEYLFIFFALKFILDYTLMYQTGYKFNTELCWKDVIKISLIYPSLLVIIFLVNFSNNNIWKNRNIN